MHFQQTIKDVVIIGGGLAGLCTSIDLAKRGYEVVLIEKKSYPFHKVCGEYLSREVTSYLTLLGLNLKSLGAKEITKFALSSHSGHIAEANLKPGGMSISRYTLDHQLYLIALDVGVQFLLNTKVIASNFNGDEFEISTSQKISVRARIAIGAFGKSFSFEKTIISENHSYVAFKNYYSGIFPEDQVAIHTFKGGYCGLSKVETGLINMTYMVSQRLVKKFKTPNQLISKVLAENKYLARFLDMAKPQWPKPLSISNISLNRKKAVDNHILMLGDSASMIAPICGNGMAMAIHSAYLASEQIDIYLSNAISRAEMEANYQDNWNGCFSRRLFLSSLIQKTINNSLSNDIIITLLRKSSSLFTQIIQTTHGHSFYIENNNNVIHKA